MDTVQKDLPSRKSNNWKTLTELQRARRYIVVGCVGFIVDAGVLSTLVHFYTWDPYISRGPSFLLAVTVTWLFHRRYSFVYLGRYSTTNEYTRFVATQIIGALSNFGTYGIAIYLVPTLGKWPIIPLGIGAAIGLLVNYALIRFYVFPGRTKAC